MAKQVFLTDEGLKKYEHEQEALEQKSLLEGKNKELEKQIDELLK